MIMGSTPPLVTRSISSFASSIMVRSAPKSVSKTFAKPRRRSAAAIFPVTLVPIGRPNSSPSAARTAGAGCTTTCLVPSANASQTSAITSFSVSAPTGQAVMHCPQLMQAIWPSFMLKGLSMEVLKPRITGPITPTFCTLAQAPTQRRHRMHLLLLRTMLSELLSTSYSLRAPAKRSLFSTPSSLHRVCSSQFSLRTQVRHFLSWLLRMSSRFIRRASRTAGVLVFTTMPGVTGSTQAACRVRPPQSTTQIRQLAVSLMSLRKQRVGIFTLAL